MLVLRAERAHHHLNVTLDRIGGDSLVELEHDVIGERVASRVEEHQRLGELEVDEHLGMVATLVQVPVVVRQLVEVSLWCLSASSDIFQ